MSVDLTATSTDRDDLASLEAGLDALESQQVRRTSGLARTFSAVWPPVLFFALFLLVWELTYRSGVKPTYALPSPADVALTLKQQLADGTLLHAMYTSLSHGVVGFGMSLVLGTALGLLMGTVRLVRRGIGPFVSGLQSLPSVAWVPASILFFGFSNATIYTVILLGAVPSIANGMLSGIDQVPPLWTRVGQVLGASGLQSVRFVLLPAALPGYVGGLRQGWAFSWRSLMAAELIAHSPEFGVGLGQLLDTGRSNSDMPSVFAGILGIFVVGVAVELLFFAPVERRVLGRRGLGTVRR
ncbi:MAG: transport system integral rane protein [Frankiales bacterium]|nr:transport system integral rane protein [Frankiales bacterium]